MSERPQASPSTPSPLTRGAPAQVDTWIGGFSMERMPEEALHHVRSSLRMLLFPGTTILSRRLPAAPIPSDPPPSLWTVRLKPSLSFSLPPSLFRVTTILSHSLRSAPHPLGPAALPVDGAP